MTKLTIQEYCKTEKVSPQSVYARIKRGSLKGIRENSILYIQLDNKPKEKESMLKINTKTTTIKKKHLKKLEKESTLFKLLRLENTDLKERILKLEKKLDKRDEMLEKKENYIGKLMYSIIPLIENKKDIIDVKIKKKKKKKNKTQKREL
jgi:hypothetical protein